MRTVFLALAMLGTTPALADGPGNRFPQPVRAGDLPGRELLAPEESQPLLGHVAAVTRRADGTLALRIRTSSLLPWAGRTVEVPLDAVALLGEHVALLGLTPSQLAALPDAAPGRDPVPPDERIRVGLVKPFH